MNRYNFSSNTCLRPKVQPDCFNEGQLVRMKQESWNQLPWGIFGPSTYRSVGKVLDCNFDGYRIKWEEKIPDNSGATFITREAYERLELFHE